VNVATFVFGLAVAAAVAAFFDLLAAGREPWIVIGIAVVFGSPAAIAAWTLRSARMKAAYAATTALLVVLAFVGWHPRKRFVHDLDSLTPGMTVDEVEAVMGRYLKGAGAKWTVPDGPAPPVLGPGEAPSPETEAAARRAQESYEPPAYPTGAERAHVTGTMTYRWCDDDWAYDSDWGCVTFKDGRVVSVAFYPD
jgi:hypothetical protein